MNTLACMLGKAANGPFLRSSDTPYYRKAWSTPPLHKDQSYRVVVEETGEVVYRYIPERKLK